MLTTERLNDFMAHLGYSLSNPQLLEGALIHSSYVHEHERLKLSSNERLEFLGDAVLNLVAADCLCQRFSELPEGELSKLRSFAVNEEALVLMAQFLKVSDHLLLGKGEQKPSQVRDAILADAMEAVIGAIYLDAGIEKLKELWLTWQKRMGVDLLDVKNLNEFDAKSRLQEYCLKRWHELPSYEAFERRTSQGLSFQVTLRLRGRPVLSTSDLSKKKAEAYLAKACLKNQLHLSLG